MPNRAALWRAKVAQECGSERPVLERVRTGLTVQLADGQMRTMRSVGPVCSRFCGWLRLLAAFSTSSCTSRGG